LFVCNRRLSQQFSARRHCNLRDFLNTIAKPIPCSCLLIKDRDNSGRRTRCHRVVGNVPIHYRTRADDAASPDTHIWQYHRMHTDDRTFTNTYRSMFSGQSFADWGPPVGRFVGMIRVNYSAIRRNGDIIADNDGALAYNVNTLFDEYPVANPEVRVPAQMGTMNDFESRKFANLTAATNANSAGIRNEQRLEKHGPPPQRS
jgi:hypothetical protein